MKKILLLCFLFCAGRPLLAQKVYFVYIQSDAHAPFYVRMGDKVMSSTASGYLILPKLKDSTYLLRLGPSANESELRFEVPVFGKDRGFLLKKFTEGWSLFDLQSLQRINPDNAGGGAATGLKLQEDRFALLLAKAANDTSLLYQSVVSVTPVAEKKKKKKSEAEPVQKEAIAGVADAAPDAAPFADQQATNEPADFVQANAVMDAGSSKASGSKTLSDATEATVSDPNFSTNEVYKKSLVTRRSESATVDGFGLVYLDDIAGVVDTIRLMIPNQSIVFADAEPATEEKAPEMKTAAAPALACNGQASEKEYFKLRKSLASVDTENDMNKVALAAFRKKCFSAEQVKSLSTLFLTQSGKYAFLEAAYSFVYDREHFAALQSEIFDPAYSARFKTLTSN